MALPSSNRCRTPPHLSFFFFFFFFCFMMAAVVVVVDGLTTDSFNQHFRITWAPHHANFLDGPQPQLHLSLDQTAGSAFVSKNRYLFGKIDMQIKLVPGNSAGTVTAYYLYSESAQHDELDFEFLGNVTGQPYILQTNVFASGKGEREQRIFLWFDPTADFHTYSVLWNPDYILFLVDDTPIRKYTNLEKKGVPFLNNQAMGIYSSLWDGESWATRGGLDKIDWTQAPFVASYRNFQADACLVVNDARDLRKCQLFASSATGQKKWSQSQMPASNDKNKLDWVKNNFMVYDYCTDSQRNLSPPLECAFN